MSRLPITAVVVSCDEADLLVECLPALAFCAEIIVVDMDCCDESARIARELGATVVRHPRAPFIEAAQRWMSTLAHHDWVFSIDPDEVVDAALAHELADVLPSLPENTAIVEVPIQFYFGRRALKGTYWGGRNWKLGSLFHRTRVDLDAVLHRRATPRAGFAVHRLGWRGHNVLHHYWMRDYRQFIDKHQRYITAEGRRHQDLGHHYSWWRPGWHALHSFVWSLVKKQGWRDGLTGIGLSAFYAWYVASGWLSLRRLEKAMPQGRTAAA